MVFSHKLYRYEVSGRKFGLRKVKNCWRTRLFSAPKEELTPHFSLFLKTLDICTNFELVMLITSKCCTPFLFYRRKG